MRSAGRPAARTPAKFIELCNPATGDRSIWGLNQTIDAKKPLKVIAGTASEAVDGNKGDVDFLPLDCGLFSWDAMPLPPDNFEDVPFSIF
jgi:hypothetical protein